MFESFKKIITSYQEKEALLTILETRTIDYFPNKDGQRPTQEHFAQYTSMVEANYKTLKSYTDQHGWPSKEKLTKMGLSQEDALAVETSAFLCVQHLDANITPRIKAGHYDITGQELASTWQVKLSEDRVVERQSEMLSLMQEDGANRGFCCYLTDRVLRNSNQPQLFGTQASLSSFGIGEEKPPQISLPNGEIVSIDVAMSNHDFFARRNSSGLSQDMESLQTHNPLSFVAEVRNHFPLHANDAERLDTLKAEIASARKQFKDPIRTAQDIMLGNEKLENLGSSFEVKPVSGYSSISVTSSVAITDFEEKGGPRTENRHSSSVQSNTLFSADSMTKMLTSASVLRMTEEEKYGQFLPDGVDTKLSDLLPILKKRYPDSTYIGEELEAQPNFQNITIAHLAQHTSGLARVSRQALNEALEENPKLTPEQMVDTAKTPRTGRFGENIGEYFYNDLGYELLGRVVIAIASKQKQSAVSFSDVINELVIDRVKEKLTPKQASSLQIFTSDQMEDYQGKTRVKARPDLEATFGKDYKDGSFKSVPSHSYDLASGGSYTDPESMSKIAFHVLASNPKFSIYKTPETLEVLNSRQVPKRNLDGSPEQFKTYGFGYESFGHPDYSHLRDHGGLGYGSNSNALVDTKSQRSVVVMTAFENLTLPLAYAIFNEEKASEPIRLDEKLFEKSKELQARYSEEQLVKLRNSLEKSYEEFRDLYQKMSEVESKESKSPVNEPYTKGLDPTTVEFTSYINGSKDWANIGKEIKYFKNLLASPKEHERVDAKGYVLTCMFKILSAIDEFDNERTNSDGTLKRETDPREKIDQETREFLGGDLSLETLKAKTTQYSNEIIRQHGEENTAPALSSVASSYGVRAYMQHLGLATEEEMRPEVEPKKYYQDIDLPMPDNMKKNIALAMEKFEESAELGNVRSMGSVVTWAEKCNHPRLHDLNKTWTTIAATAPTPNPNSQIDYAKMLKDKGDLEGARDMYQRAAGFGLIKAQEELEAFQKEQSELASKMAEKKTEPKSFVETLGLSEKEKPSSFVERMRSDKTNGKSQGGSKEL